jgi:hypothetical protein
MHSRKEGIAQLEQAYSAFVEAVSSLPSEDFLRTLGDWRPRDITAHLIGWNRNILKGCRQIRDGVPPFYYYDGPNDYRIENAASIAKYSSKDRTALLLELKKSKDELVAYVKGLPADEWDHDFGPRHYRGEAATVARSIQSLAGDYATHTQELKRSV